MSLERPAVPFTAPKEEPLEPIRLPDPVEPTPDPTPAEPVKVPESEPVPA